MPASPLCEPPPYELPLPAVLPELLPLCEPDVPDVPWPDMPWPELLPGSTLPRISTR